MSNPSFSLPQAGAPEPTLKLSSTPLWVQDLIVTAFGLISSSLVAFACWYMDSELNLSIYTFMCWLFFPAGAIGCGVVAATGYWAGARLFNHRPSRSLLINIVLVSMTTFFGIHQLHYSMDDVRGVPISKLMGFGDYLTQVIEHARMGSMKSGQGPGVELGRSGWLFAGLQVLGFSFGGFVAYGWLTSVPYCDKCKKYLGEKQAQVRKSNDVQGMRVLYGKACQNAAQGKHQAAIAEHASLGQQTSRFAVNTMTTFEVRRCPCCKLRALKMVLSEYDGRNWKEVHKSQHFTETPIYIS